MNADSCRDRLDQFLDKELSDLSARETSLFDETAGPFSAALVIFGAGNLGRKALAGLRQKGIEPRAFADSNPAIWNTQIDGVAVMSPEEAARRFGASAAFVVAVFSPGADRAFAVIRQRLVELGCAKVVSWIPLFWKHADALLPHYRIDLPSKAYAAREEIRLAFSLMADDASRKEFLRQLRWQLSPELGTLPQTTAEATYFPPDLLAKDPEAMFYDCGAFDGDTIPNFLKFQDGAFRGVLALEPDPGNFAKLQSYLAGLPMAIAERITSLPLAVGAARETLRFDAMGSVSSRFDPAGAQSVQCVPMVDLLDHGEPTYVKMDIEGAEPAALLGARSIVERMAPALAICVYHQQDHLWSLPRLVHSMCDEYHFFLRRYEDEFGDVVCYAIPPERRPPTA